MRLATAPFGPMKCAVTKAELRAHFLAALRSGGRSSEQCGAASAAICEAIRRHPAWVGAKVVAAFLPLPSEPRLASLWEGEKAPAFCFPRVAGNDVELIRLADPELLRRTNWRLESDEVAAAPVIHAADVDLFLVPGLAFTAETGVRLGRGGGYYDRLLARRRAGSVAIGICFSLQLAPKLPREGHDQCVDAVITERGMA